MKSLRIPFLGYIVCFFCLTVLSAASLAQSGAVSAANRRQFQEIASKLDVGGDLFLVLNTDKIIDRFMDAAIETDVGLPSDDPHEKEVRETIKRFKTFMTRNGFSAVHGVGISSVPLEDDMNAVKLYISRDYIDSNLPLWRGLVGWQPRRLISLDFIPADTVMARAGTPQLESLWKVMRSMVDEAAPASSQKWFAEWLKNTNAALGMDFEELIKSIRDEIVIAVRFSDTEQSVVPSKGGLITIPAPAILIVVGSNNDMLRGLIATQFSKYKIPLNESMVGDVAMRASQHSLPSLIPLQPAYASEAGFFLIGSTPEIVADALLAYRHKNGLISRPEFKNAFQGLSMVNNGIIYMSPEMGQIISHVHEANISQVVAGAERHPATARILHQLLTYSGKHQSAALVIQNWKKGVMIMGSSAIGGRDAITRLAAFPFRSFPDNLCTITELNKKTFISVFRNTLNQKTQPLEKDDEIK